MMSISRLSFRVSALVIFSFAIVLPAIQAQSFAAAPAPGPITSDGASIDQGIAYAMMAVALALTYLIHTADAHLVEF